MGKSSCSSRGFEFSSQKPHSSPQPCSRDLIPPVCINRQVAHSSTDKNRYLQGESQVNGLAMATILVALQVQLQGLINLFFFFLNYRVALGFQSDKIKPGANEVAPRG